MSENENVKKAIEGVQKIIDKFTDERKDEIESLLSDEFGELYFSAPASSRTEYHYCFPGGLALHSINVFKALFKLNKAFEFGFSTESMVIVSLFHDLGKAANSDLTPHYIPAEENWKIEKGRFYDYSKSGVYFPNHQGGLFLLQKKGFKLTDEEYQAILLNDGQYLNENKGYAHKECKLAIALHMADMLALTQEKEEKNT